MTRPLRTAPPTAPATMPERPYKRPAPRQRTAYQCGRGHAFAVPLAAGITPPGEWACRCGFLAHLAAVPDATADPAASEHARLMRTVLGRRTRADLDAILAERLADLHRAGGPGRAEP